MDQTNPQGTTNPLQIGSNPLSPDDVSGSQQNTPTTPGYSEEVNKDSVHKVKHRHDEEELSSNPPSSDSKSPSQR